LPNAGNEVSIHQTVTPEEQETSIARLNKYESDKAAKAKAQYEYDMEQRKRIRLMRHIEMLAKLECRQHS